jgi:hypothetical protein
MGRRIVKFKEGRIVRYAATQNAFGADDSLSLVTVDNFGNTVKIAMVRPLAHGGFWIEKVPGMPNVLLGDSGNGLYDDLPYFLMDLCPQGFLGRQIAEELATTTDNFPPDPRLWHTDHIGRYLISNGDDLPGNLKFGDQALSRIRHKPIAISDSDYPELADSVMSGVIPGSSAGGEQPKFTAFCRERSAHVIVKFSPKGDNEVARRWRDILITEYHATEACHNMNFPAAETRLLDMNGRLFLESDRFDRVGELGRSSMISLQSIDGEFTGLLNNWPQVIRALCKRELVSLEHGYDVQMLWIFGNLINNTDMHLGNLSFGIDGNVFRLLPVYDMCSMGFAPKSGGEVLPYSFIPSVPERVELNKKSVGFAIDMAQDFWKRVAADKRISPEFSEFLKAGNPIDLISSEL